MKIFKYPLEITDKQSILLPPGSSILSTKEQNGSLCVWALVDETQPSQDEWQFYIIGTGNPYTIPNYANYLDTVVMPYGLVWHVFYLFGVEE